MRTAATVFVPVNDVGVVSAPDRAKLAAVEAELAAAAEPAGRAKLDKQRAKLRDKLVADTAKAIAPVTKLGKHDLAAAAHALIEQRVRQPRTFPSVGPEEAAVAFVWPTATPGPHLPALERLATRLSRLGHSSSLVLARWVDAPALDALAARTERHVPDEHAGDLVLRWVGAGQVDRLDRAFAHHQGVEPRVLPATFVRYREGAPGTRAASPHTVFDPELIVLEVDDRASAVASRLEATSSPRPADESTPTVLGPVLTTAAAAGLARVLRAALMRAADQPVAEALSGHGPAGGPSERPHMAIVPLAAVWHQHANGAVLGVAIVLPRELPSDDRGRILRAISALERQGEARLAALGNAAASADAHALVGDGDRPPIVLHLGAAGLLVARRDPWRQSPRASVRPAAWTRPAYQWASVTPVALDRNPGDLHAADPAQRAAAFAAARASVVASVTRIGLPDPLEVDVVRSCVLPGTIKPSRFPRFPLGDHKPQRVLVHVRLVFASPVQGPILLGAGRYQGVGLCAPVDDWSAARRPM